jgi:hypothetical protein
MVKTTHDSIIFAAGRERHRSLGVNFAGTIAIVACSRRVVYDRRSLRVRITRDARAVIQRANRFRRGICLYVHVDHDLVLFSRNTRSARACQ